MVNTPDHTRVIQTGQAKPTTWAAYCYPFDKSIDNTLNGAIKDLNLGSGSEVLVTTDTRCDKYVLSATLNPA